MTAEPSTNADPGLDELRAWFKALERCVRAVDYTGGKALFAPDVVAFGTRAQMVSGLDALMAQQWSGVWPFIADFTILTDRLHGAAAGDLAWAAVPWTSTGFHGNGEAFDRPGRATAAFRRQDGRWLATHTHFSLDPGTPHRSFGRTRGESRV
jgi:ketosteroid isomerase-like protein